MAKVTSFVKMNKPLTKDYTLTVDVKVQLTKEFYLRLWVGKFLLQLASIVLGCQIAIDESEQVD